EPVARLDTGADRIGTGLAPEAIGAQPLHGQRKAVVRDEGIAFAHDVPLHGSAFTLSAHTQGATGRVTRGSAKSPRMTSRDPAENRGMRCPCTSGDLFDACCGPILAGERRAPTAERLMRSRFTAFARGDAE